VVAGAAEPWGQLRRRRACTILVRAHDAEEILRHRKLRIGKIALLLPVFTEGALFSTGDAHFAQGDGQVCVTAVEMGATVTVRFKVHKDLAKKRTFAGPA
jgi:formamidase